MSNLPILSMAALKGSLDVFHEAGTENLRRKAELMIGYMLFLLDQIPNDVAQVITPGNLAERGCQTSIRVFENARKVYDELERSGVVGDYREPNVVRIAPVPLYNTFHEIWRFARKWTGIVRRNA